MEQIGAIYEAIAELGKPVTLPDLWINIQAHGAFVDLREAVPVLLERLQERFELAELESARVVVVGDGGQPLLAPQLAQCGPITFVARKCRMEAPFDLIVNGQGLQQPAWKSVLEDYRTDKLKNSGLEVLVVNSMEAMAIFWSLRIAAMPAEGLDTLEALDVKELFERLGHGREPSTRIQKECARYDGEPQPRRLVLVDLNFPLLTPERSPEIDKVHEYFLMILKHLRPDVTDFAIWQLSGEDVEKLKFLLKAKATVDVVQTLSDSLEDCLALVPSPSSSPENAVSDADVRVLHKGLSKKPTHKERREQERKEFQKQMDQAYDLLAEQAASCADPIERIIAHHTARSSKRLVKFSMGVEETAGNLYLMNGDELKRYNMLQQQTAKEFNTLLALLKARKGAA